MNETSLLEARTLLAVIDRGGFGAAARALGVTQSTVSRRVAQLEARLGSRLLERTTRSVLVTPLGEQFVTGLRDVMARLRALEGEVTAVSQECEGPLRILAPLIYGSSRLVPLVAELVELHPKLRLNVELADREADVVGGEFDLALRFAEPVQSGVEAVHLVRERVLICAAPALLQRAPIAKPADLADRRCIVANFNLPRLEWRMQTERREATVTIDPLMVVSDNGMRRDLAVMGCGVVGLPEFVVQRDLEKGRLSEVLPGVTLPPVSLYMSWARHRRAASATSTVRAFLQQRLAGQ